MGPIAISRSANRGIAIWGYIGIYTPKISLPYKFLCGYWLFFDIVPVCALAKLAKLKFIPHPPNEIPGYAPEREEKGGTVRMPLFERELR